MRHHMLCSLLLLGLCCAPKGAEASAVTLGAITCTAGKGKRRTTLNIHWGQACAPGRCSSILNVTLQLGGKRHGVRTHPKLTQRERKKRNRLYRSWSAKQRLKRRFGRWRGRPPQVGPKAKRIFCRAGRRYRYWYWFKDSRGRWLRIHIVPAGKGYKFRVRAAYQTKARTQGWRKGHCRFQLRTNVPTCRALRKKRKVRKRRNKKK